MVPSPDSSLQGPEKTEILDSEHSGYASRELARFTNLGKYL